MNCTGWEWRVGRGILIGRAPLYNCRTACTRLARVETLPPGRVPDPVKVLYGYPVQGVLYICKVGVHTFQKVTTMNTVRVFLLQSIHTLQGRHPPPLQGEDLRQAVRTFHSQGTQSRQGNHPPPFEGCGHLGPRTGGTKVLDRYCANEGGPSGRRF